MGDLHLTRADDRSPPPTLTQSDGRGNEKSNKEKGVFEDSKRGIPLDGPIPLGRALDWIVCAPTVDPAVATHILTRGGQGHTPFWSMNGDFSIGAPSKSQASILSPQ
jgi:hypothetical protein